MHSHADALLSRLHDDLVDQVPGFQLGTWPGMTRKQFAASALFDSFLGKYLESVEDTADEAAHEIFMRANKACMDWSYKPIDSIDEILTGELRKTLYNFFMYSDGPLLNVFDMFKYADHGPGSSLGAVHPSYYAKVSSSQLAATSSRLVKYYEWWSSMHPITEALENTRLDEYGDVAIVEASKQHFVPKKATVSRMICVEPTLNQFFQKGAGKIIEKRLNSFFGINLSIQPEINRDLAQRAAFENLVTVDLASASDSVGFRMLEFLLPKQAFAFLADLRSPRMDTLSGTIDLHMISTMGNGFTFPLQTALFSSMVVAALRVAGINRATWSVFGDDIIIPRQAFSNLKRLFRLFGFTMNEDKTFSEGPFRESCGADFFNGETVRPVYIKKLDGPQDFYVAINRIIEYSADTGIYLFRVVDYLLSMVEFRPVPPHENLESGIRMALRDAIPFIRYGPSGTYRYKALLPVARKVRFKDCESVLRCGKVSLRYDPDAILLTLLRGDIRGRAFSIRHNRVRYAVKWKVAPHWGFDRTSHGMRLATASSLYLIGK